MSENKVIIPQPCGMDWDAMKPENGGKHCGACNNFVKDFTDCTDEEIIKYLTENSGKHICIRMKTDYNIGLATVHKQYPEKFVGPYNWAKIYINMTRGLMHGIMPKLQVNPVTYTMGLPRMDIVISNKEPKSPFNLSDKK